MQGYLEKGVQTLMAQGWSTEAISMIKWIRTSKLSMTDSLSVGLDRVVPLQGAPLKRRVPITDEGCGVRDEG